MASNTINNGQTTQEEKAILVVKVVKEAACILVGTLLGCFLAWSLKCGKCADFECPKFGIEQIEESVLTQINKTFETYRIEWLSTQRDLYTKKMEKLEQRNTELNSILKYLLQHYGKEVKRGQEIKQEIKSIQQKKNSIKDFVKSQSKSESSDESIVRLMEYLQRLDTTDDTTNESLDGYELDKSEELN